MEDLVLHINLRSGGHFEVLGKDASDFYDAFTEGDETLIPVKCKAWDMLIVRSQIEAVATKRAGTH